MLQLLSKSDFLLPILYFLDAYYNTWWHITVHLSTLHHTMALPIYWSVLHYTLNTLRHITIVKYSIITVHLSILQYTMFYNNTHKYIAIHYGLL